MPCSHGLKEGGWHGREGDTEERGGKRQTDGENDGAGEREREMGGGREREMGGGGGGGESGRWGGGGGERERTQNFVTQGLRF